MHNRYHVVLLIDKSTVDNWDALKVLERWHLLFSGKLYSQRFVNSELFTAAEQASLGASGKVVFPASHYLMKKH